MKQFSRGLTLVLLASIAGGMPVSAQNLIRPKDGPAEYPPASYTGKQYVDSSGCVFVKAGYDGHVTWVPRLARNRTQVCGFQPTQVAGTTAAPPPGPRGNVTVITAAQPESGAPAEPEPDRRVASAAPVVAAPRPVARTVTQPAAAAPAPRVVQAPVVKPSSVAGPTARVVSQPVMTVKRVPTAPVIEAAPRVVVPSQAAPTAVTRVANPCEGLSEVGHAYMTRENGGYVVRCGPQGSYAPYEGGQVRVVAAPRVVEPGHAAPSYEAGAMPGYEKRAPVAATGPKVAAVPNRPVVRTVRAQSATADQIAPTARVLPKPVYQERLLSQDVKIPKGYKPVWEDDRLNPRRAEQTLAGKRQMEMVWTQTVPRRLVPVQVDTRPQAPAVATVSSRSAAPKPAKAPLVGQFVQVGSFRTPGDAQATAQRLVAAGLPVKIRRYGKGDVVLAGPFTSDRAVGSAVATVQRVGFSGAFPRN